MCASFAMNFIALARIAQSVEQRIENPRVGGSIPPPGTISTFQTISERPQNLTIPILLAYT